MSTKSINVVSLRVVKEGSIDYEVETVSCPRDLAGIGRKFIGDWDREVFVLVCLDNKNHINALNIVSIGCLTSSIVHPREVFKLAILNNSRSIAFIHNHPSGDPEPSTEDIKITETLVQGSQLLGIRVIDHVILGEGERYLSFRDKKLAGIPNQ